jgi:N-acetylmuramoyl-L-alanine amidase
MDKHIELAIKEARVSGIPASLTLAQWHIESAAGTSELATQAHNYFGIKYTSGDGGEYYVKATKEWVGNGYVTLNLPFRKYPSVAASFADHSAFLHKDRYRPIWGVTDYKEACRLIKACGYATAPDYTGTLIKCIEEHGYDKYDKEPYRMPLKVFLSPSSQEKNTYAAGNTVEEKVCNAITDVVEQELVYNGVLVRRNRIDEAPSGHVILSNEWVPDYHVCIHTNAGINGTGTEAFCYDADNAAAIGTRLTKAIYSRLAKRTPAADRGVKTNRSFYEIIRAKAPVAYLEINSHDTKAGAQWLIDNLHPIAEDIIEGILETAGIKRLPPPRRVTVIGSVLRIRKTPSINTFNIIGRYTCGAKVDILEQQGNWGRTALGWISLTYVR